MDQLLIFYKDKMDKCKPIETHIVLSTNLTKNDGGPIVNSTLYKRMVGSLMLLNTTRCDLMCVVSLISRLIKLEKRILRYVVGTLVYDLWYTHSPDNTLIGYTDIDLQEDLMIGKTHMIMLFIWVQI